MPRLGGYREKSPFELEDEDWPAQAANDTPVSVDVGEEPLGLPSTFEMDALGDVDAAEDEYEISPGDGDHDENLALRLDEAYLQSLGEEIVEMVEADIEERRPWRDRFIRGLEMLGLVESDIDDGAFPGASTVVHPLLVEAVTQFWARSLGELFPPEGPAKTKIHGNKTQEMIARAERVQEFMNYEISTEDEAYIQEKSRLLWMLPFVGCGFTKTFRDPILDRNVGIYVPAEDLIVPAEATSLKTTPRFAHRMRKDPNEVTRLQLVGHYRKCDLDAPMMADRDELEMAKDEAADQAPDDDEDTIEYVIFEACIDLEIPGEEHLDEQGEITGLKVPYIVSVEKDSRKVLAIYRNWDEDDPQQRRRVYIEKYSFVPGIGFYDLGLFHLIGGLQTAATGALRVLLDGAASSSLSGGFISKNANLKGQNLITQPGVWQPVDATSEDLQKAFFPAPVKEPSMALFQLLGFLTQAAQRFTATTDVMTGDADPKGAPVGTTVAMIEQGGKVMSTIHRMIHGSLGRELRLRYELCRKYAPSAGYPYDVAGQDRTIYSDDFAAGVEVVPVSDPNIFSSQQRLAQSQAILQLAVETGTIPVKKAAKRVLQAMKVPDIDDLMPDDPEPQAYDAAGEIQAMLMGKPIMVMPEQPHSAHLQVLAAFANNPQFGGNPAVMQQIGPALISVMGQHMAYALVTAAREQGVPAQYMDPATGQLMPDAQLGGQDQQMGMGGPEMGMQGEQMLPGMSPPGGMGMPALPPPTGQQSGMPNAGQPPMVPPEAVTAMLAQIAPHLMQAPGMPGVDPAGGGGEDTKKKMELEGMKVQSAIQKDQAKISMERERHEQKMQMEAQKLEFERYKEEMKLQLETMKAEAKAQVEQVKGQIAMQTAQQQGEMQRQQMVQDQAMNQQKMVADAQMQQSEMASQARQSQQKMAIDQQSAQNDMVIQQQKAQQPVVGRGKLDGLR